MRTDAYGCVRMRTDAYGCVRMRTDAYGCVRPQIRFCAHLPTELGIPVPIVSTSCISSVK